MISLRIKQLRKKLNLTMDQFGKSLGVTKSTISNIENGNRNATNHFIKSVCLNFNVNEDWLRNGTGDMFVELTPDEEIEQFIGDVLNDKEDNFKRRLISALAKLDDSDWLVLEKIAHSLIEKD